MTPATLPLSAWQCHTDTQLAALHGGTRQKWSAYRKYHRLPKSPAGHGGRRSASVTVSLEKAPVLRTLAKLPIALLRAFAESAESAPSA